MKSSDSISEIQLNAYIDNELHDSEKLQVLNAFQQDTEIEQQINDLRRDMDLLKLAYKNPPLPRYKFRMVNYVHRIRRMQVPIAATIFLVCGLILGWQLSAVKFTRQQPAFTAIDNLPSDIKKSERILIHISEMDDTRIRAALAKTEQLLEKSSKEKQNLKLEVVANADGLAMLRKGSPYKKQIQSLKEKYPQLEFKACGIAMENARLKEAREIELIPEAQQIPAALGEILQKIQAGWMYVKS